MTQLKLEVHKPQQNLTYSRMTQRSIRMICVQACLDNDQATELLFLTKVVLLLELGSVLVCKR